MAQLIITNGDAAAEILAAAGLSGRMQPWRDVLHEGPIPPAPSLSELSDVRAAYLSERFGLPYAEVRSDFAARDAVVTADLFDAVTIWLEHDLYDQLQLLQILHFYDRIGRSEGLTLVQADDFLGSQTAETVLRFADRAAVVTPAMLATAAGLWNALSEPTPEAFVRQVRAPAPAFPFLRPALNRFLEELPATVTGLSRSERTLLAAVAGGSATPREAFSRLIANEDAAFMGDWSAFRILDDLAFAPEPLIAGLDQTFSPRDEPDVLAAYMAAPLAITRFGRSVLSGDADVIAVNGIDRWWGGTHLTRETAWRWDGIARRLIAPSEAAQVERDWDE